jgi:hypothetical protein
MKTKAKKRKQNSVAKIYYNYPDPPLYWKVRVINAEVSVTINGSLEHALKGYPGTTIACHLSNCGMAKENKSAFPHPCLLVAFTPTTAYVVTKFKHGKAVEAVRYSHSYSRLVHLNDTKVNDTFIKTHPEMFERSFTLRPWRKQIRRGGLPTGNGNSRPKIVADKGARLRAMKAGLITKPVAEAIEQMAH